MKPEKKVEQRLIQKIKAIGGRTYKWVSPGCNGVPDRIVIYKGLVVFVELKAEGGRLSEIQKARIDELEQAGAIVKVLTGVDEVDAFVSDRYSSHKTWGIITR